MKIALNEVRSLFEKLFGYAEEMGFKELKIDIDYYWLISFDDAYSPKAPEIVMGSLVDDWKELEKILHKGMSTVVDFERLGNVFKIIGYEITQLIKSKKTDANCLKIALKDVKQLCFMLLTKTEKAGFEEVEIDVDHYWTIPFDCMDKIDKDPVITTKSLVKIWESLRKFLDGIEPIVPAHFEDLANIIITVGEGISRSKNYVYFLIAE